MSLWAIGLLDIAAHCCRRWFFRRNGARAICNQRAPIRVNPFMWLATHHAAFRMIDGYGADFFPGSGRYVLVWNSGIDDRLAILVIGDVVENSCTAVNPRRFPGTNAMVPWFRVVKIPGRNERE